MRRRATCGYLVAVPSVRSIVILFLATLGYLGLMAVIGHYYVNRITRPVIGPVPVYPADARVCFDGEIRVSGTKDGRVIVSDANGELLQTFQMSSGIPVRQVFLLDHGRTVGAAQLHHTFFWDRTTGRRIGVVEDQIYGFSHDQTRCIGSTGYGITLYSYPALRPLFGLQDSQGGIMGWKFSPNDRFLADQISGGYPSSDANYPDSNTVARNVISTDVFDLTTGRPLPTFKNLWESDLGNFSADSQWYFIPYGRLSGDSGWVTGSYKFNMRTGQTTWLKH